MPTSGKVRGRLTTTQVNDLRQPPRDLELQSTADNAPVPIIYGERSVPGMISDIGTNAGGDLVCRVVWCAGEIFQIETIYMNGSALPASAIVHNYRGTEIQGVDNYVALITTPDHSGYDEKMVALKPQGYFCCAYSVIVLPAAILANIEPPRFQAVIKGSLVYDVRYSGTEEANGDPFNMGDNLLVGYSMVWDGSDGATESTGIDQSGNAVLVNEYAGNAAILSNQLELDGTGDYVRFGQTATSPLAVNTDVRFGTGAWTWEITFTPDGTSGARYVFVMGDAASDRGLLISTFGAVLLVSMAASGGGGSWGIMNGVSMGSVLAANTEIKLTIEFTGREYFCYVNGEQKHQVTTTSVIRETTREPWVGQLTGAAASSAFDGSVRAVRLTKGVVRYGGQHTATAVPYADSDLLRPGYVYTNLTACCFAELAMNPFYGLGVTSVNNLISAIAWNESLLGGAVERANLDLVISGVRQTEEYLDLLAEYASCVWYYEDDTITLYPDTMVDAAHPSGWEMGENGDFNTDASAWTLGTGWSHNATVAILIKTAGTASGASQVLTQTFEAGVTYVASLLVALYTSGNVRLELNGVPLIEYVSAYQLEPYTYEFTADGTETGGTLRVWGDSSFAGWIKTANIKRKFWYDANIVAGSLQIQALSNSDSPTRVAVQYTTPVSNSPNWLEAEAAVAQIPGVDTSDIPLVETRLDMRGITRSAEATNKAQAKLARMQNRVRVSWITTDIGVAYQKGTVVDLYDPETSARIYVFVESVTATADAGRYRATGMRYDPLHYPNELVLEGDAGLIPVGAIAMLREGDVPSGWQLYSTGSPTIENKAIKCAGNTVAVGDTGGTTTLSAQSGNTTTAGAHGAGLETFPIQSYTGATGSGSGTRYTDLDETAGGHLHTYNTGTITPDVYRREQILIEKITSAGTFIPENVIVFGLNNLNYPNMVRWTTGAKRILFADSANANAGDNNQTVTLTTGSTNDSHEHYSSSSVTNGSPVAITFTPPWYSVVNGGGAHTHGATLSLTKRLKRVRLAAYTGTDDYDLGQGLFLFWDASYASIPADFTLCTDEGLLGTPIVEDYFIEIAAVGQEETYAGDNTVDVTGYTNYSATHNHKSTEHTAYTYATYPMSHAENYRHRHEISDTGNAWQPPWYALALIMYNPNPAWTYVDVALFIEGGQDHGSTDVIDSSIYALTDTIQGTGSLSYTNAQTLFGLTTLVNNGKRIKYTSFDYGNKFTIEVFFRNTTTDGMILFGDFYNFEVVKNGSGDIELYIDFGIEAIVTLGLTSGEWFYVGLCYDYSEWRLYAGKQSVGTATSDTFADASRTVTGDLYILDREGGSAAFTGYMAQFRVVRGAAHLTGSIVAIPTEAFPNDNVSIFDSGVWDDDGYWIDSETY